MRLRGSCRLPWLPSGERQGTPWAAYTHSHSHSHLRTIYTSHFTSLPKELVLDCGRKAEYPEMSEQHIIGSLSYLWPLAVTFAGPVWIHTAVHRCNFHHRPPPPQESRHVCCLRQWTLSIQFVHTPVNRPNKSKQVETKTHKLYM